MKKICGFLFGVVLCLFNIKGVSAETVPTLLEITTSFNNHPGVIAINDGSSMIEEINVYAMIHGYQILLVVHDDSDGSEYSFTYDLQGNILSHDFVGDDDKMVLDSLISAYLMDSIEHLHGYQYEETFATFRSDAINSYTLENEGFSYDRNSIKIDISKKIPLIDVTNVYFTPEDLEEFSEFISGDGSSEQSKGNVWYNKSGYDGENTLLVAEKNGLTKNAYNSIISLIQVMFKDTQVDSYFKTNYPEITHAIVDFEGFKVEYEPVKTEFEEKLIPSDSGYSFLRITINKDQALNASRSSSSIVEEPIEIDENPKTGVVNYLVFGLCLILVSVVSLLILNRKKTF